MTFGQRATPVGSVLAFAAVWMFVTPVASQDRAYRQVVDQIRDEGLNRSRSWTTPGI